MSLVEGVGDEVIEFFIALLVIIIGKKIIFLYDYDYYLNYFNKVQLRGGQRGYQTGQRYEPYSYSKDVHNKPEPPHNQPHKSNRHKLHHQTRKKTNRLLQTLQKPNRVLRPTLRLSKKSNRTISFKIWMH